VCGWLLPTLLFAVNGLDSRLSRVHKLDAIALRRLRLVCETSEKEAGDFPARMAPFRDHALYERLFLEDNNEELMSRGVVPARNILWTTSACIGDLPKPDLLHCLQLGVLEHLLSWVLDFLRESRRAALFDQLWVSIPQYQDMVRPTKTFQEIGQ
jgi:hypothetical protein